MLPTSATGHLTAQAALQSQHAACCSTLALHVEWVFCAPTQHTCLWLSQCIHRLATFNYHMQLQEEACSHQGSLTYNSMPGCAYFVPSTPMSHFGHHQHTPMRAPMHWPLDTAALWKHSHQVSKHP